MPAARQRSRSPAMACAVMATIGVRRPVAGSASRMRRVASKPSISGICTSIRMRSKSARRAAASTASRPFIAWVSECPRFSRMPVASARLITLSSASRMRSAAVTCARPAVLPRSPRRGVGAADRDEQQRGEMERRALAGDALDPHATAHFSDELRGDGQAESGAAVGARGRAVGLREGLEDQRLFLRRECRCRCRRR